MVWQRLTGIFPSIRHALSGALAFVSNTSRLATVAQPFVWLARKVWWFVLVLAGAITSLLRLGPLDLLKRTWCSSGSARWR